MRFMQKTIKSKERETHIKASPCKRTVHKNSQKVFCHFRGVKCIIFLLFVNKRQFNVTNDLLAAKLAS